FLRCRSIRRRACRSSSCAARTCCRRGSSASAANSSKRSPKRAGRRKPQRAARRRSAAQFPPELTAEAPEAHRRRVRSGLNFAWAATGPRGTSSAARETCAARGGRIVAAAQAETLEAAPSARSFLDRLEFVLGEASRVVAIACVCGMLFVAAVTMLDVLLRWVANEPIPAINEIVQMTFSVAISACIPAGMTQRVNLKIDLVARYFGPCLSAWLEVLGSAFLWLFYTVLAVRIFGYAATLAQEGRTTVILGLPQAPFIYGVAGLLAFGSIVQAIIIVNEARHAATHGTRGTLGAALVAGLIGLAAWQWVAHAGAISAWAQGHVGLTVTIVFVAMWLLTLVLIPIAAIMGIVGVISSTMFIGLMPSLGAAATEVTGFLGNTQLATLPLFLMMGSFAAVADISEDVYRLAH